MIILVISHPSTRVRHFPTAILHCSCVTRLTASTKRHPTPTPFKVNEFYQRKFVKEFLGYLLCDNNIHVIICPEPKPFVYIYKFSATFLQYPVRACNSLFLITFRLESVTCFHACNYIYKRIVSFLRGLGWVRIYVVNVSQRLPVI